MPAYLIALVEVKDWEAYGRYREKTPRAIEKYGGRFVVRGGRSVTLEGPEETRRIVVLEFDSLEQAQAFYHSSEYQEAKRLREAATEAQFVAVEGYEPGYGRPAPGRRRARPQRTRKRSR